MGNGRYYTFDQFFIIMSLMIVAMFLIASLISLYIRQRKAEITTVPLMALLIVLFRIVEHVTPNIELATYIRHFSGAFILVCCTITYVLVTPLKSINKRIRANALLKTFMVIFTIATLILKSPFLVANYTFPFTSYGVFYKTSILILLGGYVGNYLIRDLHVHSGTNHASKIITTFRHTVTLYFPLLIYAFVLYNHYPVLDFIESWLLVFMVHRVSTGNINTFDLYDSIRFFDKIADLITDYIVVTDIDGSILYQNQNISSSSIFNKLNSLTHETVLDLFKGSKKSKKVYKGKEYVQIVLNDKSFFFNIISRKLSKDNTFLGTIYTIVDISDVMKLLFKLEEQQQKSITLNSQLKNDSEIVYQLEKEKEIKKILDEILLTRDREITSLINNVNQLIRQETSHDCLNKVDDVIQQNAQILDNVRAVVSSYRTYYGGDYD